MSDPFGYLITYHAVEKGVSLGYYSALTQRSPANWLNGFLENLPGDMSASLVCAAPIESPSLFESLSERIASHRGHWIEPPAMTQANAGEKSP